MVHVYRCVGVHGCVNKCVYAAKVYTNKGRATCFSCIDIQYLMYHMELYIRSHSGMFITCTCVCVAITFYHYSFLHHYMYIYMYVCMYVQTECVPAHFPAPMLHFNMLYIFMVCIHIYMNTMCIAYIHVDCTVQYTWEHTWVRGWGALILTLAFKWLSIFIYRGCFMYSVCVYTYSIYFHIPSREW